jgi:hypothetical protein
MKHEVEIYEGGQWKKSNVRSSETYEEACKLAAQVMLLYHGIGVRVVVVE